MNDKSADATGGITLAEIDEIEARAHALSKSVFDQHRLVSEDTLRLTAFIRDALVREARRKRTGAPANPDNEEIGPSDLPLAEQIKQHADTIYECGSDLSRDALHNIARQVDALYRRAAPAEDVVRQIEHALREWAEPEETSDIRRLPYREFAEKLAALAAIPSTAEAERPELCPYCGIAGYDKNCGFPGDGCLQDGSAQIIEAERRGRMQERERCAVIAKTASSVRSHLCSEYPECGGNCDCGTARDGKWIAAAIVFDPWSEDAAASALSADAAVPDRRECTRRR